MNKNDLITQVAKDSKLTKTDAKKQWTQSLKQSPRL
jgi:nucleoid DNA-binding protein